MPDTETPTTAALPTPTEVVAAPTTEAPPADEQVVEPPAEEPKPEADAETAKPEPEQPAWADKTDFYDVLELDEAKPFLERRDQRRGEEIRADYQAQYDQEIRAWKSTETHKQVAGAYGSIIEKLGESDLEGAEKLIARLEAVAEPYSEDYIKAQKGKGAGEAATELFGVIKGSLDHRGQDELQDYLTATRNAGWGDILKKRDEIREGRTKQSSSEKVTALEAQIEDLKAKKRPDGPDTTTKRGADGRTDEEIKLDPNTSTDRLREIRAREQLAG